MIRRLSLKTTCNDHKNASSPATSKNDLKMTRDGCIYAAARQGLSITTPAYMCTKVQFGDTIYTSPVNDPALSHSSRINDRLEKRYCSPNNRLDSADYGFIAKGKTTPRLCNIFLSKSKRQRWCLQLTFSSLFLSRSYSFVWAMNFVFINEGHGKLASSFCLPTSRNITVEQRKVYS